MTANSKIETIEAAAPDPPDARGDRLKRAYRESEEALYHALHYAGLLENPHISPGGDLAACTPVERILIRHWQAYWSVVERLDGRVRQLTRTLRHALACDALTDEQREAILGHLYGRDGAARNGKMLTAHEAQLIAHYRATDAAGKQMLRTLLERLVTTTGEAHR